MKRVYTIQNGWYKIVDGQSHLVQIGPREFDPASWEIHEQNAAQGCKTAPYTRKNGAYVFATKLAFEAAKSELYRAGYAS